MILREFLAGISVKVILGCLYGFLFIHYYPGDDTWRIHQYSLTETQVLFSNPREFFINAYTPL